MPEIDASVEFEVECSVCRTTLDVTVTTRRGDQFVIVQPCETCLERAREDTREEFSQYE